MVEIKGPLTQAEALAATNLDQDLKLATEAIERTVSLLKPQPHRLRYYQNLRYYKR